MERSRHRTPIHPSLVRPILLAGGERELVLINVVLIFALVLGVGPNPVTLGLAGVLATAGHGALVALAKVDPQGWRVFARHFQYRDFYPARAHPFARGRHVHPFTVD